MEVLFKNAFYKDTRKLGDIRTKKQVNRLIDEVKDAASIHDISGITKLKGYPSAYRKRIDNY